MIDKIAWSNMNTWMCSNALRVLMADQLGMGSVHNIDPCEFPDCVEVAGVFSPKKRIEYMKHLKDAVRQLTGKKVSDWSLTHAGSLERNYAFLKTIGKI